MSIWIYGDSLSQPAEEEVSRDDCLFCGTDLLVIEKWAPLDRLTRELKFCQTCGWWCKNRRQSRRNEDGTYFWMWGACAQLKRLDPADVALEVREIERYLPWNLRHLANAALRGKIEEIDG